MGDVLTLIEQAEKAFDKREADEMARKFLAEEDFTFEDFLQQMNAIKKMGSLKSMLKMMPGMQGDARPARRLRRPRVRPGRGDGPLDDAVRAHPPQADQRLAPRPHRQGLRRHRDRRQPAARALRRRAEDDEVAGSRRRWRPAGHARHPRHRQARSQQQPQRKKSKSGNPAKRAAEERAAAEKAASGRAARRDRVRRARGRRRRVRARTIDPMADFDPSNLPKGFEKFLGGGR